MTHDTIALAYAIGLIMILTLASGVERLLWRVNA